MKKLHELQEERAAAVTEMRALNDKAESEKRDLTADETAKFGTLKTTINDLDSKIGRAQTLADAERSAPAIVHGKVGDGQYEERARDFSITKAIRGLLPADLGGGGDIGFEREISSEVARRSGRKFEGLAVPDQIFYQERRTLLTTGSAGDLVPNTHRGDLFIDRLRNALVTQRLGATYLDGLVGSPIDIPRQVGSSVAQWVPEDGSLTETDATFDDVNLSPKTVGAMTSYSRRTLLNTSPAIEQIVRNDLASVIASAIDLQAMVGDGTGNKPLGITHTPGVFDMAAGPAISWDEVLAFISMIEGANALDGSLGWAMNPYAKAKLRGTLKVSGGEAMLMEGPNELGGYPAIATNALPGSAPGAGVAVGGTVIFGDWSQLLIASWTGIDILLNPYETTAYSKGRVLVRAMKDVDVAVRHGEAFAFEDGVTT